jgi:hypothetical protein
MSTCHKCHRPYPGIGCYADLMVSLHPEQYCDCQQSAPDINDVVTVVQTVKSCLGGMVSSNNQYRMPAAKALILNFDTSDGQYAYIVGHNEWRTANCPSYARF